MLISLVILAVAVLILPRSNQSIGADELDPRATSRSEAGLRTVPPLANRPLISPDGGYVGSAACRECHTHEHATWHSSYHRKMAQVVTPDAVVGDFNDVQLELDGSSYHLFRRGDEFWFEMDDPAWHGPAKDAPRVQKQLVQSTGSHHLQAYWYSTGRGRELDLMPFAYRTAEQRWISNEDVFLKPARAKMMDHSTAAWNQMCIRCHATGARPRLLEQGQIDTQVAELGISCEACHGPGESHVSLDLDVADQLDDLMILHPKDVSPQRASQVCGQCHGMHVFRSYEAYEQWRVDGYPFRPGEKLGSTRLHVCMANMQEPMMQATFRQDPGLWSHHFWSDGLIRVGGREFTAMIESPCYKQVADERAISCLSCHQMHQSRTDPRETKDWADDQLAPGMRTNQACTQCHRDYEDDRKLVAHTHHGAESSGSRCLNCHMPFTTYGLLKATRNHAITSPDVKMSVAVGRPNACNGCHLDKTLQWTSDFLRDWYGIDPPGIGVDEQSVAASVLLALKGDAGQRALVAWSMGWPAARAASGSDWMVPHLGQLMTDNYSAVRFIAHRSLRRREGVEDFGYDFVAPAEVRDRAVNRLVAAWIARPGGEGSPAPAEVLLRREGMSNPDLYQRLLSQRDDKPIYLNE